MVSEKELSEIKELSEMYERGMITQYEFANFILDVLIAEENVDNIKLDFLPEEVYNEFQSLLSKIKDHDYKFFPFVLGGTGIHYSSEQLIEIVSKFEKKESKNAS
jgi:hypothetical protein